MHVILDRTAFLKALTHCQSIVEKRTATPALSHVMLEAQGQSLKLTSTDLEHAIIVNISAEVKIPGRMAVSAHTLLGIVRKVKNDTAIHIKMSENQDQMILTSGRSCFTLSILNPDEFPVISSGALPKQFKIPAADLKKLLSKSRFAMSVEDTAYYLNGVYLHAFDNKELRAVATDTHRLALISVPLPEGAEDMHGVIVSGKTVDELLGLIEDEKEIIDIELSETQISFKFKNTFFTSRLIDGRFPNYEPVIPSDNDKILYIDMKAFAEAVDRVSVVSSDKIRGIRIELSQGRMSLTSKDGEIGHGHEELEIDYIGDTLEIGFNARYLMNIADQFDDGKEAEFQIAGPGAAVVIRHQQDPSALYVIMPMRI